MEGTKKTARQRFLRRTRALTLTISIPSMLVNEAREKEKTGSVISLKRSQSSRDVWRSRRSCSEHCLAREEQVEGVQPGSLADMREEHTENSFGYRLKRSLTVSHIIDNFNKSFRVKRSQSQREVGPKKNRFR